MKDKIDAVIEISPEETICLLRDLIEIPSISGDEKNLADFCCNELRKVGLSVDEWEINGEKLRKHEAFNETRLDFEGRPNVVGVLKGTGGGRSILLNGHMDVVTPEPIENWTHDPWGGEIENDRIYGRGAADMKSGLSAIMMALRSIVQAGIELQGDVVVEFVVGEEEAMGNGTLASLLKGYNADGCIFTEPTELNVHPAMRGGFRWKIKVEGKSIHGTQKWIGVDAIEKTTKILSSLKALEKSLSIVSSHPLFETYPIKMPITPDIIQGGEWQGMVPERCMIEGYFEILPGQKISEWQNKLKEYIARISEDDPWLREHIPRVEFGEKYPPYEIGAESPLVRTMEKAINESANIEYTISGFNSGCDAYIRAIHGCSPTVIFGPGSLANSHCPDEYVASEEVITCAKVLAYTILEWCGYR